MINAQGIDASVQSASVVLLQRCAAILKTASPTAYPEPEGCGREHLLWMCATAEEHVHAWPVDKLSRWLGFIQGVMTFQGLLNVDEERNVSRPLFHAAYRAEGLVPPASVAPDRC